MSEMLNNEIRKDYTIREWTVPHTVIVMNVINGLFYWAKFLAPNPYTLKTITLINPCTKQVDTSDSFIAKLAKKEILETSVTPVNKKQLTVHKTTVTTPPNTSNTSSPELYKEYGSSFSIDCIEYLFAKHLIPKVLTLDGIEIPESLQY